MQCYDGKTLGGIPPMDASDKVATIDTYNSSPNTPPSKVAVPLRCRSRYILGSTLRLRYSSQYEMRGQISQSGGNGGHTVFLVRTKVASRELPYSECRVAVLDAEFAQESESGLKSAQSPAGKHENCMQSPVSWAVWPASRLAAGWQPCIPR